MVLPGSDPTLTPDSSLLKELRSRFVHYPAKNDQTGKIMESIRAGCWELANDISHKVPTDTREFAIAVTHLEQCMFWANAAIARHQDIYDTPSGGIG